MNTALPKIGVSFLVALIVALLAGTPAAQGQAAVIRKPAQEVIEALGRYLGRTGGRDIAEELVQLGGETAVRRIAERAVREGGDDALNALIRVTRTHGRDAIRAADNAVDIPRLLRAVDDLPEGMSGQAIRRLADGAEGRILAEAVERFGSRALRAEVRHPGIGGNLVRHFGDDGAELATRTSRDQAITISRHADDIAKLPETQRAGVLRMLREDTDRATAFIGRFVEKNPGKILFTAASTTIILANAEKVLGGGEIVIGPDGEPIFVPKPGWFERQVNSAMRPVFVVVLPIFAIGLAGWLSIKLWYYHRYQKLRHDFESKRLADVSASQVAPSNASSQSTPMTAESAVRHEPETSSG